MPRKKTGWGVMRVIDLFFGELVGLVMFWVGFNFNILWSFLEFL